MYFCKPKRIGPQLLSSSELVFNFAIKKVSFLIERSNSEEFKEAQLLSSSELVATKAL